MSPKAAAATNRGLVEQTDVLLGNEEDFSAALGYALDGVDDSHTDLDVRAYERLHRQVLDGYPNLTLVATSLREAHTATLNDWSAVCTTRDGFLIGPTDGPPRDLRPRRRRRLLRLGARPRRLLAGAHAETAVACDIAHGALAMTTPGDSSMARRWPRLSM